MTFFQNYIYPFILGSLGAIIGTLITIFINVKITKFIEKNKLRYSAIEKKLKAHQEAYSFWYYIRSYIHKPNDDPEKRNFLKKAFEWWPDNSLYLTNKSRKAFFDMIWNTSIYEDLKEGYKNQRQEINKIFKSIINTGKIIEQEVGLDFLNLEKENKIR